ncbi:hypothetical protein [Microbacterium sp. NPDC089695]|uniref:hypothetical protein n=1 Tax=Microbacterium sp. NPDC089695 TaxID=3364198 RepID=UPI003818F9C7
MTTASSHTPSSTAPSLLIPVSPAARVLLPLLRITLGLVYLWPFVDKMFGFGFATPPEGSVLAGGSPSTGYLSHTEGAFADVFRAMAGNPLVDVLFMLGLGAVGIALVTGVCLHLAAIGGTFVMGGIYLSSVPLANNPLIDEHIVFIVLGWLLATLGAGTIAGLGAWWQRLSLVRRHRWLA